MSRGEFTDKWLTKCRPGKPLLEAWILSAIIVSISNTLAQAIDAYKKEEAFVFDLARLLRFLCLDLITAPLNYKWQELLERSFPRHATAPSREEYRSIPLDDRDVEKDSNTDEMDDDHELTIAEGSVSRHHHQQKPKRRRKKRKISTRKNWKNIWIKWFIDCITLGAIFNTVAFLVIMGFLNGQPRKILHNLRTKTVTIIINGYKIWPFANIIAHSVISFERRIPFFATVALCWNVYLSLVAERL
ncbi:Mpv17 [Fonsecaea pedrosoi]|nr:Mpv17 [Fonsecaea pedrosoi]